MRWLFVAAALASLLACVPVLVAVPRNGWWHSHVVAPRVVCGVTAGARRGMGYAGAGLVIGVYEVCWSLLLHLRGATGWQIGLSWTLVSQCPLLRCPVPGGWPGRSFRRRYLAAGSTLMSAAFAASYPFLHSVWLLVGLPCGPRRCGGGRRAGASHRTCAQRSSRPARASQGAARRPDGRAAVAALVAGANCRVASLVSFRGGVERDRRACGSGSRGAGGAFPAGTGPRAARVEDSVGLSGGCPCTAEARPGRRPGAGRGSSGSRPAVRAALALSQPGVQDHATGSGRRRGDVPLLLELPARRARIVTGPLLEHRSVHDRPDQQLTPGIAAPRRMSWAGQLCPKASDRVRGIGHPGVPVSNEISAAKTTTPTGLRTIVGSREFDRGRRDR